MDAPYQRLAAKLRQRIDSGEWSPGTRLPSARRLAEEYRVGRGTAEHAVAVLRRDGTLEGRPGARPTVAYRTRVHILTDPHADWPHGTGEIDTATVRADEGLSERLRVPRRAKLVRIRVECVDEDGRPAMLVTTWRRGTVPRPWAGSEVLAEAGEIAAEEARFLGLVAGVPALRLQRTRFGPSGRPVEVADLVLPADRWRLRL